MATIDILASMGTDALANHFQIVIPNVSQLGGAIANINMRVLTVEIPEYTIETYEIYKRGRKMTRPNGVMGFDPTVTFTFRNDKYWQCYNSLMNWMQFVQNNQTMAMGSDSGPEGMGGASEFRTDVEIWSINSLDLGVPNNIWIAQGAFPTSIDAVSFDEESGEPLITSVTLSCMNIKYPSST